MTKIVWSVVAILLLEPTIASADYLGNYTANPYAPRRASPQPNEAPSGSVGNIYNNRYGNDGNSPKLYDSQGQFRGNLNANPYDPNSVANPYGRYGSKYSQDSINNPYGAGSPYQQDSPSNRYGTGMKIYR